MDLHELYESNKDFKEYVDKYCENHCEGESIPVEEALKHRIVMNYALIVLKGVK